MRFLAVGLLLSLSAIEVQAQSSLDSAEWHDYPLYEGLEDALANPDSVFRLSLRRQKLDSVPLDALLKLPNLKELDLSRNRVVDLPVRFYELKGLEGLDLSNNKLKSFPAPLYSMSGLKVLKMGRNDVDVISGLIGQMQALEHFDIWGNMLGGIPDELIALPNITYLDFRGMSFSQRVIDKVRHAYPKARVHFDPSCSCAN